MHAPPFTLHALGVAAGTPLYHIGARDQVGKEREGVQLPPPPTMFNTCPEGVWCKHVPGCTFSLWEWVERESPMPATPL